jgi:hypothetical protein
MAELPDNNYNGQDDDDWRRGCKYIYFGREVSYDELRADVEAEAAGLDPDQWIGGEFDFDDWLSDSLRVGTIKRVHDEDEW